MYAEIPYDGSRDSAWEAGVDALPWVRGGEETAAKQGLCPRCGHEIAFVEAARPASEDRAKSEQGMFEECNCGVRHPGTPEGRIGCGANGLIRRASCPGQD